MMEENIERVDYQGKEIILVATAHVSKQSAELIKKVIDEERPDSVCVELDEDRYRNIQNPKAWENTDIVQVIKSKRTGFLMANIFLGAYQKRIAGRLDTTAGQEMLQGIKSAAEINANLVLADRNIRTTFLRIWRKLTIREKFKLFFALLFSFGEDVQISSDDVEKLLEKDTLESAVADLRQEFPIIGQILLDERDQHLAHKIKNAPGKKVVAVLGGAHVAGVKQEIFKPQDMEKITEVPPGNRYVKYLGWVIPAVIIGLIIYAFVINIQTGLEQLSSWVLWNSALAGIFTALALGHPLSILTAIVAAPFTSLNPLLACGWFAGLVEATVRKPTVQDINNVPADILKFKGFFKNRFLRVLTIVIMANIGSSIGTFVAGLDIIRNLF